MCIINHWPGNWECFMDARSASQGLGPSVRSPEFRFGSSVRRENRPRAFGLFPPV